MHAYLCTFESVFRILHVPSFLREYQQHSNALDGARVVFLLQLGLVMTIGASLRPQEPVSDLAKSLYIESAQKWLYNVVSEARITPWSSGHGSSDGSKEVETVQMFCLLLETQQSQNNSKVSSNGVDFTFSPDALYRLSMRMGFHINPAKLPHLSFFTQEMRRRLWAVVQEMALQASMDDGQPPSLKADDHGPSPWNVTDEQFDQHNTLLPPTIPQAPERFTHTSIQIALHKSLPLRIDISNSINDPSRDEISYAHALQLSSQLSAEIRSISTSLGRSQPHGFAARLCGLLLQRFLLSLHGSFALRARVDLTCYYSRKAAIDASLSILSRCSQASPDDYYARLLRAGSRFFVGVPIQAASLLCYEVAHQVGGDPTVAVFAQAAPPSVACTTIRKVVEAYLHVLTQRLRNGSEDVKPYVLLAGLLAGIDSIQSGQPIDNRGAVARAMQMCRQFTGHAEAAIPPLDFNARDDDNVDVAGHEEQMSLDGYDITEGLHDSVENWFAEDQPWDTNLL